LTKLAPTRIGRPRPSRNPLLTSTAPPAVVLGGGWTAVPVTRSLGEAGVPVYALGGSADAVRWSRSCTTFVPLGREAGMQDRWLEWLRGAPPGSVILPCGDEGLELIARNRTMLLELGLVPFEANDDVLLAMLDKSRTYELARDIGIESPLTFNVHTQDDIAIALERISYPCALKPVHSHAFARHFAGMKAFRVHNDDDMRAALARTVAFGIEMIVTEIIPGGDDQFFSYYSYMDEEGEPLLHATKRKLRQYPIWFGSGCFHATDRNPEVAELGLRFFEGVGLRGLGNVEFKRDARDGRLKLIECNHRFTAATGLMRAAGLDLPLFVYNRLTGRPLPPVDEYRPGQTMWYPMRDLRAFAAYRRHGEISLLSWLRSIMRRHHYPVASLSDPRPVLVNNLRVFGRVRRVLSRNMAQRQLPGKE
jgi:predicted ATP-grasp superfamily ATP-dependent carboligase